MKKLILITTSLILSLMTSAIFISVLHNDEAAFTILGFSIITTLVFLPLSALASLLFSNKIKVWVVLLVFMFILCLTGTYYSYINQTNPENSFKRIILDPIPSSVTIINSDISDNCAFLNFSCSKEDMKIIIDSRLYQLKKENHTYSWGSFEPNWWNESDITYIEESKGSWLRMLSISSDSTTAYFGISWY